MSRVIPPSGETVQSTDRKRLTPKQKAELLARQNGCCGQCGTSLVWLTLDTGAKVYGPMIDEHILRLFVAGGNELDNRQMWCVDCSKAKTKAEASENAKIRRIIRKENPETRKPPRMKGRSNWPKAKTNWPKRTWAKREAK